MEPIDELRKRYNELAKLAGSLAHEIKNPLTPMRLSVQSFQHKFDPQDPDIHKKVNEYTKTLIQQIDTMSSIASAFSPRQIKSFHSGIKLPSGQP
mgnify:CR=1 FL=1